MDLQTDNGAPCASLHGLATTIRALVQPSPLLPELQNLVTLLSHVEVIRSTFLGQLEEMLRLDEMVTTGQASLIHEDNDDNIEPVALTDEEHIYISAILRRKGKMRRVYRDIINGFSLLVSSVAFKSYCSLLNVCFQGHI